MDLESFLASAPRAGPKCRTCAHSRAAEINEEIRAFARKRAAGETHVSWIMFARQYLCEKYVLEVGPRSVVQHAEKCVGERTA